MSRIILFTIIAVFLSGCTNNVAQRTVDEYNEMFERVMSLEKQMSQTEFQALSANEIVELNEIGEELYYKTIYLAFENERIRYTNYLWVEVEAVVPQTEYFTTKCSIE